MPLPFIFSLAGLLVSAPAAGFGLTVQGAVISLHSEYSPWSPWEKWCFSDLGWGGAGQPAHAPHKPAAQPARGKPLRAWDGLQQHRGPLPRP